MKLRLLGALGIVSLSLLGGLWEPVRWRAEVVLAYFTGKLDGLSFGELAYVLGNDVWLQPVLDGRSLSAVLENPFESPEDIAAGARIFAHNCSGCHGPQGKGATGPALITAPSAAHGSSDLGLYRTITDGIAGTAMPPAALSMQETWQVAAFIRHLRTNGPPAGPMLVKGSPALPEFRHLSALDLERAERNGTEWRTYSRTYNGWRFSPLEQVSKTNIASLQLFWIHQLETNEDKVETTPIVVGDVMYLTEPPSNVIALDAGTGKRLWRYRRDLPKKLSVCCGSVNRGVAVLDGRVFFGTLDGHVIALDARSGQEIWDATIASPAEGYSITGAPLAIEDMIVTGVSGGEFGIRGFIQALDAKTGARLWRFYTIPGPGEPGHDTWPGRTWKTGGGPTWITGSYDPALGLIYWGVGNPSPVYQGAPRSGDNLYTDSVVALDSKDGHLVWHFQFTPNDTHDWDANQVPVLADIEFDGSAIPALAWANRNGFYYLLDRRDGRFITGVPFVRQTWAEGLDSTGRPIPVLGAEASAEGTLVWPGVAGGVNWQSPAFNPKLGLFFVHASEGASVFTNSDQPVEKEPFAMLVGSGSRAWGSAQTYVRALNVTTGRKMWEYKSSAQEVGSWSGLLATAGGLVFGGSGERAFGLDATSGAELWHAGLGGRIVQGPITYSSQGLQVIVFVAGRNVIALRTGSITAAAVAENSRSDQ